MYRGFSATFAKSDGQTKSPQTGFIGQSTGFLMELSMRFERTTSSLPRNKKTTIKQGKY